MTRDSYRRAGPAKILVVLTVLTALPAFATTEHERPNVLLIVLDTVRADHLSAYGYERPTSPNIDRLAAQGVLYESPISAASWTLPAHASLFTGLFVRDHQTHSENQVLAPAFDTLAELLQEAGYRTAGFSNNVWTNDDTGLKQGFEVFHEMWRTQDVREVGISVDDPATDMGAAATNERVFEWLDGLGEEPFFVFINYFEPHLPYRPPQPFDDDFLPPEADAGTVQRLRSFYSPREYGYILKVPWMKVSEREIAILRALYDAEIAYTDAMIGKLVEGLRGRGLLDDTLVVITSDHGEHFGENHMLSHKLSLYEPLLRVPLVLWNPARIGSGVRIETQVQAHDVFGTILDLAGVRTGGGLPLADDPAAAPRFTYAELARPQIFLDVVKKQIQGWDASVFDRSLQAVRGPRYKLILGSDGRAELYDVVADPTEEHDLAAAKPEVVDDLRKALEVFNGGG